MRILYCTQYFPPEVGATQTRAFEMARYLASSGHHVTVVTEFPNHPSGIMPPEYRRHLSERKLETGIDVLRLWVWASPEKSFRSRMRFYLSYMGMAALVGTLLRGRYDLVYATSPPLFTGVAGLMIATVRRVPFVFEVRDVWPESAVALGELTNRGAIAAAEKLEMLLYRCARKIIVVTNGICSDLVRRGVPSSKIALVPNGANTDQFRRDEEAATRLRNALGMQGKFVVLYAGIHGLAQGLASLLEAAAILKNDEDIVFVFVGEGPKKAELIARKESLGLTNVRFLPEVTSHEMPGYLTMAGCAVVPLRDEPVFRGALPSKMFEAWACECPVVLSVAGEAVELLERAGAGIAVAPENPSAIADTIRTMSAGQETARSMGRRGREFTVAHYSRQNQAARLETLLRSILD